MRNKLVLIETSAWIEALRQKGNLEVRGQIEKILESGLAVMCEPILLELYNGAKGSSEQKKLKMLNSTIPILETNNEIWNLSFSYAMILRKKGITIPNMDIIIKAIADFHKVEILSIDNDFKKMEKVLSQNL